MGQLLLFLDFDGVTHPVVGTPLFRAECMAALQLALKEVDVEIVVTSTWRETQSLAELKETLKPLGKTVQGVTPVIDEPFMHHVRYHEVLLYLTQSNQVDASWIAIDDTPGFYPDGASVYYTDPTKGFTSEDIPLFADMLDRALANQAIHKNDVIGDDDLK